MTVLINISLAVRYGAYVCNLAVLDCECELCYSCVAVGSCCLFETVLAVLQTVELCIITCELCACYFAQSCAAVYLYACKCLALFLNCEYE